MPKNKITLLMPLLWAVHIDAMAGCSSPFETGPISDGEVTDVYGTPNYSEGALLCINDLSKYIKQHIRDYPDFREIHMGYIHKCWPNGSSYYWMATDSQCSEVENKENNIKPNLSHLNNNQSAKQIPNQPANSVNIHEYLPSKQQSIDPKQIGKYCFAKTDGNPNAFRDCVKSLIPDKN